MFNASHLIAYVNDLRTVTALGNTLPDYMKSDLDWAVGELKKRGYVEAETEVGIGGEATALLFTRRKESSYRARFSYFNNRPANSKAPWGDCSTRTIALATGVNYNAVYKRQCSLGGKHRWNEVETSVEPILRDFGYLPVVFNKKRCPFHKVAGLLSRIPCKACLLSTSHIAVAQKGTLFDCFDSRNSLAIGCFVPSRFLKKVEALLSDYV